MVTADDSRRLPFHFGVRTRSFFFPVSLIENVSRLHYLRIARKRNQGHRILESSNIEHRLERIAILLFQNRRDPRLKKGLPGQITHPSLSFAKHSGNRRIVRACGSQMSCRKMQRRLLLYFVPRLPTPIKNRHRLVFRLFGRVHAAHQTPKIVVQVAMGLPGGKGTPSQTAPLLSWQEVVRSVCVSACLPRLLCSSLSRAARHASRNLKIERFRLLGAWASRATFAQWEQLLRIGD
jgi:hypothetical protein